jgi:hypothetical protein
MSKIHSKKNLLRLGEDNIEAIRRRVCEIEKLDMGSSWTDSGLDELSYYNIELYSDVPGGPVNFIAGAMAMLHRVNGPHVI